MCACTCDGAGDDQAEEALSRIRFADISSHWRRATGRAGGRARVECLFYGNFDAADAEALQQAVEEGILGERQHLLDERSARDSRAKV